MSELKDTSPKNRPIGVFDSGVGGLTVLRALRSRLPAEDFLYLGDTARLPYGAKSPESVARYALQASRVLVERGVKLLVVACNTATSAALPGLRAAYAPVPVVGVIEPGAQASALGSRSGRIAVIATESTVRGGAYVRAILDRRPDAAVVQLACPLFVALAEEGWTGGEIAEATARRYLAPVFNGDTPPEARPDCLVLGCTHFPVLRGAIAKAAGPDVRLVDSAETTADAVFESLCGGGLCREPEHRGHVRFLATDGAERFARVGSIFLGEEIGPELVEIVDL